MRFEVRHVTRYAYSRPVFVEPTIVRLRPRDDAAQRLVRFSLDVCPAPAGRADVTDAEGNSCVQLWFAGTTEELRISTSFTAEVSRSNPFGFLPAGHETYGPAERDALRAYLRRSRDRRVRDFAASLRAANPQPAPFLTALCTRLYENLEHETRPRGGPRAPGRVLDAGRGACRDVAVLFMATARSAGIASRFVSGYQQGDPDTVGRELHAWAESYVPGGGWIGFDPTHGLAVADGHVAVASGATASAAAPVAGTFRGTGARADLETHIELHAT